MRRISVIVLTLLIICFMCIALVACSDGADKAPKTDSVVSQNEGNTSDGGTSDKGESQTDGDEAVRERFVFEEITVNGEVVAYTLKSVESNAEVIVVPELNSGRPVVAIGDTALHGTMAKKVIVPDSVQSIGNRAFSLSYDLEEVVFTESSKLTSIGDRAFYECNSLTTVNLPDGVKEVGNEAFYGTSVKSLNLTDALEKVGKNAFYDVSVGKSGLIVYGNVVCAYVRKGEDTAITVEEGIVAIASGAFEGVQGITSVSIPSSVKHIGARAFSDMKDLADISVDGASEAYSSDGNCIVEKATETLLFGTEKTVIPNSVRAIADDAFYGIGVKNVNIPDTVISIGARAFMNATELVSITLPSKIESIPDYAFFGASKLDNIRIPATVTAIANTAFSGCDSLKTVKIDSVWVYVNANVEHDVGHLLDYADTVFVRASDTTREVEKNDGTSENMSFSAEIEYLYSIGNGKSNSKSSNYLRLWFAREADSDEDNYDMWRRK